MKHIESRDEHEYVKDFKIKELPFELNVDRIIKITDGAYSYIGAEFISKDKKKRDYYLAKWSSGSTSYGEVYLFIKIHFDLYLKYLRGDIGYNFFRFESLKRSGVEYRMLLPNSQFVICNRFSKEEKDMSKLVFKEGNKIECVYGYAFSLETMPTYYMNIPYEISKEPEYVKLIEEGASFGNKYDDENGRKYAKNEYERMDENFKAFVVRECKIQELLK